MRGSDVWDLAINVIGLLGILALSVPALYANRYGRLLYRLAQINPTSPALIKARTELEAELKRQRDSWTWKNSALLVGGTILAGLSYGLGIAKALVHPA